MKARKSVKFQSVEAARKKIRMEEDGSEIIYSSNDEKENVSEDSQPAHPMTQAIVEDQNIAAEEVVNNEVVQMPFESDLEEDDVEIPNDSIMALLELYWINTFLPQVIVILKMCIKTAMSSNALESKRFYMKAMHLWNKMLIKLLHGKENKALLKRCSWTVFVGRLRAEKSFMMFCSLVPTDDQRKIFQESVDKLQQGPSLSPQPTKTTSTSSTTVPTPVPHVDAALSHKSAEEEDAIAKLFGLGNTQRSTGLIQQNIFSVRDGKLYSIRSPGESGYTVVKLETYSFSKVILLF